MMNVKVISKETIKPSSPTPNHLRYHQLSLFDHINSPFLIPTVYFFSCPKYTTPHQTNTFLSKLKSSLSTALSIYYPLAGRLDNANYVTCNDTGVPYVLTHISSTISDVVFMVEISNLDTLMPPTDQKGFSRLLLAVQINVFKCGGVAIGLKSNHGVFDGFSLLMFISAWADITNGKDPTLLPLRPYFDVSKAFPPLSNKLNMVDHNEPNLEIIIDKPLAKWFMFKREKIDDLRLKICSFGKLCHFPSIGMVLSAFIWSRISLAYQNNNKNSSTIPNEVFVAVNIRPKVTTICNNENTFYFGNMIINAIAKLSLAQAISYRDDFSTSLDYLEKVKESVDNILHNDTFIKNLEDGKQDLRFVTDQFQRQITGESKVLGFSIVPSIKAAVEPDFGWGEPVWSMTGTMVKDLVLFTRAGPYSKDIIATINLSSEDMIKLEADEVFNSFVFKRATHAYASSKL